MDIVTSVPFDINIDNLLFDIYSPLGTMKVWTWADTDNVGTSKLFMLFLTLNTGFSNKSNITNSPHRPLAAHASTVSCLYWVSQVTHQFLLFDKCFAGVS